jgi:luciferase family oxidoreductase group 1
MIGQIAAATTRIRVGSGGVMLPNHAPLMVAERFKVLEALYPGRIDLGIGRAPGTDHVTSVALRRRQDNADDDDFLDRFQELLLFENDGYPADHPFRNVHAMPNDVALPPIFLLGSSDYSAQLAARIGAGFSFAHHFFGFDPVVAMRTYREQFRPSQFLQKPHAILAVAAVLAETDTAADRLASTIDLNFVRRAQGVYAPLDSPEVALAYNYSPVDRERMRKNRERLFVGSPATVRDSLGRLIGETQADEAMITTMIYDHAARKHSYTLLAEAFSLAASRARSHPQSAGHTSSGS